MTDLIDIMIEDPRWTPTGFEDLARDVVRFCLLEMDLPVERCEVSILACDDARIKVLNADFREKDAATNVLSWPAEDLQPEEEGGRPSSPEPFLPDGDIELGDIAISYDTMEKEARAAGKPLTDHVTHLLLHGVLHLLGYDHITDKDATVMEAIEIRLLGKRGIESPY
ncbi:MAG: rRNA maturation RNase YbeY [Halocynthiibacter sp.]